VKAQWERRRQQWDAALCPAFLGVLDAAIRAEDVQAAATKFPQETHCEVTSREPANSKIILKCSWPHVVINREQFASGLQANGPLSSYRDEIDEPIADCIAKIPSQVGPKSIEDPTDDKKRPSAERRYTIERDKQTYDMLTYTQACDDSLQFTTSMGVQLTAKTPQSQPSK
jgi:hypothetical protein